MPKKIPATTNPAVDPRTLTGPVFAQPQPTPDPQTFVVAHPSDGPAYAEIDALNREHKLVPLPFPAPRGGIEPVLSLAEVFGNDDAATASVARITANGQIVFHSGGDCGSVKGPKTQNEVADKMVADFNGESPQEMPQFHFLLGDVVYSFGEVQYYYDQFYDPYREYPAPILAAAGNHDGMVAPGNPVDPLFGFLRNFCAETYLVQPEAGGLSRTAQIQPGVFFTFEAPFVRILTLYSGTLEDPGIIADPDGTDPPVLGRTQLDYLAAALQRVKGEAYAGALLFAHHHPSYTAGARHGWSIAMQAQIDAICEQAGVWPHADLAAHAHNYQRFTRSRPDGTEIPYVVCGNIGHGLQALHPARGTVLRAPQIVQAKSATNDQIVLENYDALNFGYLRVVVTASQLRIEYHPASDGSQAKTPDDSVTVDLATRTLTTFVAPDLGRPAAARGIRSLAHPTRASGAGKGTRRQIPSVKRKP